MEEAVTRATRRRKKKKFDRTSTIMSVIVIGCMAFIGGWGANYYLDGNNIENNNVTAVETLTEAWSKPTADPAKAVKVVEDNRVVEKQKLELVSGEAFATISIPSLFEGEQAVAEGYGDATTSDWEANNAILDELRFAHYASTAAPGEAGSFAISGHRNGPGAVLEGLEDIPLGASATVRTVEGTYEYKMVQAPVRFDETYTGFTDAYPLLDEGSTEKSDVAEDPKKEPGKYLTVTSCGYWDASVRVAVVFELVEKK